MPAVTRLDRVRLAQLVQGTLEIVNISEQYHIDIVISATLYINILKNLS
jgi:hypothetical protein